MKGSEIKVGQEYAVRLVNKALSRCGGLGGSFEGRHKGFPRTSEVKRAMVIEKRSNGRIIVQHDAMVSDPNQHIAEDRKAYAIMNREVRFVPGKKILSLTNANFVCSWDDYEEPGQPDGRSDAPLVSHFAGMTFIQSPMAVSQ